MLGREIRLTVDLVYEQPPRDRSGISTNEYVDTVGDWMQRDFQIARENLRRPAVLRKAKYDGKVKKEEIVVGQKVWYYCPRRFSARSPRWTKFYTGSYTTVRIIDSHTVVIKKSSRSKPIVVHRYKLKPVAESPVRHDVVMERRATEAPRDAGVADDRR